ncbi:MAG: hypothetical protein II990_08515 [Muribaculaceae bacterium]|nr:hypothetical protein [Muribaculaceae bacterium]
MKKCPVCSNEVYDHVEKCSVCGWVFTQETSEYNSGDTVSNRSTIKQDEGEETKVQMTPPAVPSPSQHGWGASAPNTSVGGSPLNNQPQKKTSNNKSMVLVWSLIAVCALAALGVVGYYVLGGSASSGLLKMIPAETDLVVTVDGAKILKSAGCKLSGHGVEFPRVIEKLMKNMSKKEQETLEYIAQAKCFNIDQAVFAVNMVSDTRYSNHDPDVDVSEEFALISITNKDEVVKFFEDLDDEFDFDEEKGYQVCNMGWRDFIVVEDDYCWLYIGSSHVFGDNYDDEISDVEVVKRIEKIKNNAQKESIADVSYKREILAGGNAAALMFDSKNLSDILGVEWGEYLGDKNYNEFKVGVVADLEKESISLSAKLFDKDGGEIVWAPGLGKINGSLAKYLNSDDVIVMATAIDPNFSWEKYISLIEEKTNEKVPDEIRGEIVKWLSALKGTVMYAVGFESLDKLIESKFTGLNVMAIVEMKDGKAKEAIDESAKLGALLGGEMVKKDGSALVINADNIKFRLEEKDGNLVLSNRQLKEQGNENMPNSFFDGKTTAMILNINKDSDIAELLELPGNSVLEMSNKGDELNAKLMFSGITDEAGILEFIMSKVAKYITPEFEKKIERKFESMYGYDDEPQWEAVDSAAALEPGYDNYPDYAVADSVAVAY